MNNQMGNNKDLYLPSDDNQSPNVAILANHRDCTAQINKPPLAFCIYPGGRKVSSEIFDKTFNKPGRSTKIYSVIKL